MGRIEKEIPEEILKQAEENPEQQEELAQEVGVSKKTLQKRIKKVNLQASFVADSGDKQEFKDFEPLGSEQNEEKTVLEPAQYDAVAMSAVMLMDGMGLMMKNIGNMLLKSKGKELDYEVLTESEKTFMVTQLKSQPEALNYLAQNDFMMPVLAFGSILATFVMHFKIKDADEYKKDVKKEFNLDIKKKQKETKLIPKEEKSTDEKLKDLKLNIKTKELNKINTHPDARLEPKVDFLD